MPSLPLPPPPQPQGKECDAMRAIRDALKFPPSQQSYVAADNCCEWGGGAPKWGVSWDGWTYRSGVTCDSDGMVTGMYAHSGGYLRQHDANASLQLLDSAGPFRQDSGGGGQA